MVEYLALLPTLACLTGYGWAVRWSYLTWNAWKTIDVPKALPGHVTTPTDYGGLI